jgi:hypothetical protein
MRVFVLGTNASGEAEFFITDVVVSEGEYSLGIHYDKAIEQAESSGYEGPFIAFDENDRAAKQITFKE